MVKVIENTMKLGLLYASRLIFESLDDKSVTVRDRDSMKQTRVKFEKLNDFLLNIIKLKLQIIKSLLFNLILYSSIVQYLY